MPVLPQPFQQRAGYVVIGLTVVALAGPFIFSAQSGNRFPLYVLLLMLPFVGRNAWRGMRSNEPGLLLCTTVFLLYMGSSALWSDGSSWGDRLKGFSHPLSILVFLLAFTVSCQHHRRGRDWFGLTVVIAASLNAIAAATSGQQIDGRLVGFGQIDTAVIAALGYTAAFLVALHQSLDRSGARRWLYLLCALILGAAIIATGSRTGWVVALAGSSLIVLLRAQAAQRVRLMLAGAIGAGALLILVDMESVMPRGDSHRLEIWQAAWQKYLTGNLLLGRGLLFSGELNVAGLSDTHAHNIYLTVLLQAGAIGLLLALACLTWTARELFRRRSDPQARLMLALLLSGCLGLIADGPPMAEKINVVWLFIWWPVATVLATAPSAEPDPRL